jgi:hypothetical protein
MPVNGMGWARTASDGFPLCSPYSLNLLEGVFSEVRTIGGAKTRAMRLLTNCTVPLLLAAARHKVRLVSHVSVPAFTAIDLVPQVVAVVR